MNIINYTVFLFRRKYSKAKNLKIYLFKNSITSKIMILQNIALQYFAKL